MTIPLAVMTVTCLAGLNVASASYRFASPTDLITDITLVHPFNSRHQLNEDPLADAEAKKNRAYKADYHFAFASVGLQFLWPARSGSPSVSLAHG
jgi:hypothetical protein